MRQLAALLCFLMSTPVQALDLQLRETWELNQPGSLAFDHELCALWVANESRELVLMSIFGEIIERYDTDLQMVKTVTPTADGVLVSDWKGLFQELTKQGKKKTEPYGLNVKLYDTEGVVLDQDGDLLIVQDTPAHMVEVNAAGDITRELSGLKTFPVMYEPQGIAIDAQSGHIFITDDREGSNSLFEFAPDWSLISVTSLRPYGLDPEGVAVNPQLGTIYIGFDQGAKIGVFDYTPAGDANNPALDVPFACGLS